MKALELHTKLSFLFLCFNATFLQGNPAETSVPQPSSTDGKAAAVAAVSEHSTKHVDTSVYRINITSSKGLIGQIKINLTDGTEPVDVVHQFCVSNGLPLSKRREILTSVCSTIPCFDISRLL